MGASEREHFAAGDGPQIARADTDELLDVGAGEGENLAACRNQQRPECG